MLRTEGIVLKEMRYRDTSKILNVFTKDYGKLNVMARGAYRPKSQLIANTQPFSYSEFQLHNGKNFYYLNQGYIIDPFYSIRDKMERVVYGQYILELIDKSMEMEQENEKIFLLALKGLKTLSLLEKDFLKFISSYELKFISFLGYRPSIDKCVVCGSDTNISRFNVEEGGMVCTGCNCKSMSTYINGRSLHYMRELLYTPLDEIHQVEIGEDILNKIHSLMVDYILFNIDRKKFNSLSFVKSLE